MAYIRQETTIALDSMATEEFIRFIDNTFDIFNSRSTFAVGYKSPLRPENATAVFNYLDRVCQYLRNLRFESDQSVECSKRKMAIVGVLVATHSIKELYRMHLQKYSFFNTYRLSQDHLELLFNIIRRQGGWNNNPSARVLRGIFKGILFGSGCIPSNNGNVLPMNDTPCPTQFDTTSNPYPMDVFQPPEVLSEFKQTVIAYIAGWVVKKVKEKLDCTTCANTLETTACNHHEYGLINFKNNGGLRYPSNDLLTLLFFCEKLFSQKIKFEKIIILVVKKYGKIGTLFSSAKDHHMKLSSTLTSHYYTIIRLLAETYLHLRNHYECKKITRNNSTQRKKLCKLVLFKHQ